MRPIIPNGIPASLWKRFIPDDNPVTEERASLGKKLYFDKRLSADGTVSCATCHDPAKAYTDNNPVAIGVNGKRGTRNAPSILNAVFSERLFWDGREISLEDQAKQPLINPLEMGMKDYASVVARVKADPDYMRRFKQVFGKEGITIDTIAKAIAAFERTRLSGNSPFDHFIAGDKKALTEAQKRGWELFQGKAKCIACHVFTPSSPFFTDFKFYNTGVMATQKNSFGPDRQSQSPSNNEEQKERNLNLLAHTEGLSELGRYNVTKQNKDIGAFKTPTLRDVELTAPYMHNGSEKTLLDVAKFYNRGGEANPNLDERIQPLKLTDEEMNNLVEFMRSLTSNDVLREAQLAKPQTRVKSQ